MVATYGLVYGHFRYTNKHSLIQILCGDRFSIFPGHVRICLIRYLFDAIPRSFSHTEPLTQSANYRLYMVVVVERVQYLRVTIFVPNSHGPFEI